MSTTRSGPVSPPAAAAEQLLAFEDCAELRGWYVDAALPLVGPWGFEPWPQYIPVDRALGGDQVQAAVPTTRGTATDAVGNSETGTNVQEADVDEPDVAKTDGQTVYRVQGRRLLRALPLGDGRVAMVDRGVRIIDVG